MRRSFLNKLLFVFLIIGILFGLLNFGLVEASGDKGVIFEDIEAGGLRGTPFYQRILGWLGGHLAKALMWIVQTIVTAVALGFLGITELLYRWVTSPGFMEISFTGPDNVFVYQNWIEIRNLANIGIVLGLVYTGLRTALDLGSFQVKRTLVRLLALALLINFTPVLIGLMVDAAQIAMNYFLGAGRDMRMTESLRLAMFNMVDYERHPLVALIQLLVLTAGIFFIAFLFLILAVTFLLRYLVIWILVILSPLAFLAFAFPGAKKFWQQWWSQFISWTFIGVPVAFFISLADRLNNQCLAQGLFYGTSAHIASSLRYGDSVFDPTTFCSVIPAVLLYIGYKTSLSIAPSFTKTVISSVRHGSGKVVAWGGRQIKQRAGQAYDAGKQKAREAEMLSTARRLDLKINTQDWHNRQRGHAVRIQAAEEIMKSTLATPGEKALAARWMSTDQKMIERKTENTRYGQKLAKADVNELKAEIFLGPPNKRAMAIHDLIKRYPEEARKILPTVQFSDATEAQRVYTALYDIGHKKDASLFAMSQAGRYGQNVQTWAHEMGEKDPDKYLPTALANMKSQDIPMIAAAYKTAVKGNHNENRYLIVDNLLRSNPQLVLDLVFNELRDEDVELFKKTLLERAPHVSPPEKARPVLLALRRIGWITAKDEIHFGEPASKEKKGDKEAPYVEYEKYNPSTGTWT